MSLYSRTLTLPSMPLHSICCNMILWSTWRKASFIDTYSWKGNFNSLNTLITYSDNYGYSFKQYRNSTSSSSFKVSYNVKSESISVTIWESVASESIAVCCTSRVGFSWMRDSVTSCMGHFKSIGSLSYRGLPNSDTLHYVISKKITLLETIKSLSTAELSSSQWWIFSISNFSGKLKFLSLATNCVSCFPWYNRLMLFISEIMSVKYPSLNNHSLSFFFFQVTLVFSGVGGKQLV